MSDPIERARELLAQADKRDLPLYVSPYSEPFAALRDIRQFLARLVGPDDTGTALVVACLDRVIDRLRQYRLVERD